MITVITNFKISKHKLHTCTCGKPAWHHVGHSSCVSEYMYIDAMWKRLLDHHHEVWRSAALRVHPESKLKHELNHSKLNQSQLSQTQSSSSSSLAMKRLHIPHAELTVDPLVNRWPDCSGEETLHTRA
eukprot:5938140-Karenia_brevis.AAC.1